MSGYNREHGTRVTKSETLAEKMAAIRRITEEHQYAVVDGVTLDLFTASAITKVYEALNETNQAKLAALPIQKMAAVAFKLIN